jgi:hypothetical protein
LHRRQSVAENCFGVLQTLPLSTGLMVDRVIDHNFTDFFFTHKKYTDGGANGTRVKMSY